MRRSLAQLQTVFNTQIKGVQSVKKRRVTCTQTQALFDVQYQYTGMQTFTEAHMDSFDDAVCRAATQTFHFPHLDDVLDLRAVWSSVEREKHRLDAEFRDSWATDFKSLHDAINVFCPKWQLKRESMLQDKVVMDAFLFMNAEHYNAIGPLVVELQSQVTRATA